MRFDAESRPLGGLGRAAACAPDWDALDPSLGAEPAKGVDEGHSAAGESGKASAGAGRSDAATGAGEPGGAGTPCSQNVGAVCDGKGSCVECLVPTDCHAHPSPCVELTYSAGVCGQAPLVAGMPSRAGQVGHPLLAEFFEAVASWRPGYRETEADYRDLRRWLRRPPAPAPGYRETEADYRDHLHRLLWQRVPAAMPQAERPLGSWDEGTAGRGDLVLGDSLLIEFKRGLNAAKAQQAIGQLRMYVRAWNNRGPIVLLICDAEPPVAQRYLGTEIAELRARAPVAILLAPRATRDRRAAQLPAPGEVPGSPRAL